MSTSSQDRAVSTTVRIFGAEYSIRSPNEPEYVQKVAELVDEAMRRVSTHRVMRSNTEIAVLACMHIAGELMLAQEQRNEALDRIGDTTDALTRILDKEPADAS